MMRLIWPNNVPLIRCIPPNVLIIGMLCLMRSAILTLNPTPPVLVIALKALMPITTRMNTIMALKMSISTMKRPILMMVFTKIHTLMTSIFTKRSIFSRQSKKRCIFFQKNLPMIWFLTTLNTSKSFTITQSMKKSSFISKPSQPMSLFLWPILKMSF